MGVSLHFKRTITAEFKNKFSEKEYIKTLVGCPSHGDVGKVKYCPECGNRLKDFENNTLILQCKKVLDDVYNSNEMNVGEEYCYEESCLRVSHQDSILRVTFEPIDSDDEDGFYTDSEDADGYRYSWIFTQNDVISQIEDAKVKYRNILSALEENFGDYDLQFSFTRYYG